MKFQRRLRPQSTVDLVPMIDVVFQLVVFFMVSSTFNLVPAITLQLPSSTTAEVTPMTTLTLTIESADRLYLNKDLFSLASLKQRLSQFTEEERATIQSVIVSGDEKVSYSLMIEVLDVLRETGFRGINLKTREPGGT